MGSGFLEIGFVISVHVEATELDFYSVTHPSAKFNPRQIQAKNDFWMKNEFSKYPLQMVRLRESSKRRFVREKASVYLCSCCQSPLLSLCPFRSSVRSVHLLKCNKRNAASPNGHYVVMSRKGLFQWQFETIKNVRFYVGRLEMSIICGNFHVRLMRPDSRAWD